MDIFLNFKIDLLLQFLSIRPETFRICSKDHFESLQVYRSRILIKTGIIGFWISWTWFLTVFSGHGNFIIQ